MSSVISFTEMEEKEADVQDASSKNSHSPPPQHLFPLPRRGSYPVSSDSSKRQDNREDIISVECNAFRINTRIWNIREYIFFDATVSLSSYARYFCIAYRHLYRDGTLKRPIPYFPRLTKLVRNQGGLMFACRWWGSVSCGETDASESSGLEASVASIRVYKLE